MILPSFRLQAIAGRSENESRYGMWLAMVNATLTFANPGSRQ
jgi:hypothetical protein